MEVILKNKDAFKQVLKNYKPSEEALYLLRDLPLVILQGISGSGRNTIINHLLDTGGYYFIVSDTTRPPKVRDGHLEENGVQYFFRDEQEVLQDLENGLFLEAELIHDQQVSGISLRELRKAKESGKIAIDEVALEGTINIQIAKPDTVFFFVVPPSYQEWVQRLKKRETMSMEELQSRTKSAIMELEEALSVDRFHFVINDSSERSAEIIDQVVREGFDDTEDSRARQVALNILAEIQTHIT